MVLGSVPVTRLRTLEAALCWTKRTAEFWPMLKLCQLRMAFGLFVTVMPLPTVAILALPNATLAPAGSCACENADAKAVTKAAHSVRPRIG